MSNSLQDADGQSVRDLHRMNNMWISVVVRDGTPVRVDADTVLRAGDDVLVLAEPDHERALWRRPKRGRTECLLSALKHDSSRR